MRSEAKRIWCQEDGCYEDDIWMKKTKYIGCLELCQVDRRCTFVLAVGGQTDCWAWDGFVVAILGVFGSNLAGRRYLTLWRAGRAGDVAGHLRQEPALGERGYLLYLNGGRDGSLA